MIGREHFRSVPSCLGPARASEFPNSELPKSSCRELGVTLSRLVRFIKGLLLRGSRMELGNQTGSGEKPGHEAGRRELGEASETAACQFLLERGYQILARNVRYPVGELDIVATDGQCWVFVEVRSRRSGGEREISETITEAKERRVIRAALEYLNQQAGPWRPLRFDVITVLWARGTERPRITHIQSAFGED